MATSSLPAYSHRGMTQQATYWAPAGNDGAGGLLYEAPVPILCRWEDRAELFRDAQGREVTSTAVVYPNRSVALGGFLALGMLLSDADPKQLEDAREIRGANASPSFGGTRQLNRVYL